MGNGVRYPWNLRDTVGIQAAAMAFMNKLRLPVKTKPFQVQYICHESVSRQILGLIYAI
jgi:hypothetical protein